MQDYEPTRGKIKLTLGNFSIAGEGDQDWLDRQIEAFLDTVKQKPISNLVDDTPADPSANGKTSGATESLASYLRSKGADSIQVQRLLATAGWLTLRGNKALTTANVSKALRENQQKRLGNSADCLNQNVAKGFCEKTPTGFFITPEGWAQLGENPNH